MSSALTLCTRTSTTRTVGDRLTLLYSHLTISYYIHRCTINSLTTRTRKVAERTAVRFDKEQYSLKTETKDGGERSSRIPGWDGEADTYFSYARRARQFVEGTKIQERYLCGPRLEAQLTGESAVEGCRPGWLSTKLEAQLTGRAGVQARLAVHGAWRGNTAAFPQDTLCQACTTRHGFSSAGVLLQVKKGRNTNQWRPGARGTETNTPRSDEHWQDCNAPRHQMNILISHHRRISHGTGSRKTRKK